MRLMGNVITFAAEMAAYALRKDSPYAEVEVIFLYRNEVSSASPRQV